MAKRYFEYNFFVENYEEIKDGFKPSGTLGSHKILKIEKKGKNFLIFSNATNEWQKNRAFLKPGQILCYDRGSIKTKTPSKLGQFKIKIDRESLNDYPVVLVRWDWSPNKNRNNCADVICFTEGTESNSVGEDNSYGGRDLHLEVSKPGLYLVEFFPWDGGYKRRFVVVGNHKVTDDEIKKVEAYFASKNVT